MTSQKFFAIKTLKDVHWGTYPMVPKGALLKSPVWVTEAADAIDAWKNKKRSAAQRLVTEINNRKEDTIVEVVELEVSAKVIG